jgi:WD40 repeat protein
MLLALEGSPDAASADELTGTRRYWNSTEVTLELARRLLREQPIRIGHNREVTGVAVTPDGTRIVIGSLDDTARIWDRTSGREFAVPEDAESWVLSVAVSPDRARIVTGSDDGNARIWDSASGKRLTILT